MGRHLFHLTKWCWRSVLPQGGCTCGLGKSVRVQQGEPCPVGLSPQWHTGTKAKRSVSQYICRQTGAKQYIHEKINQERIRSFHVQTAKRHHNKKPPNSQEMYTWPFRVNLIKEGWFRKEFWGSKSNQTRFAIWQEIEFSQTQKFTKARTEASLLSLPYNSRITTHAVVQSWHEATNSTTVHGFSTLMATSTTTTKNNHQTDFVVNWNSQRFSFIIFVLRGGRRWEFWSKLGQDEPCHVKRHLSQNVGKTFLKMPWRGDNKTFSLLLTTMDVSFVAIGTRGSTSTSWSTSYSMYLLQTGSPQAPVHETFGLCHCYKATGVITYWLLYALCFFLQQNEQILDHKDLRSLWNG